MVGFGVSPTLLAAVREQYVVGQLPNLCPGLRVVLSLQVSPTMPTTLLALATVLLTALGACGSSRADNTVTSAAADQAVGPATAQLGPAQLGSAQGITPDTTLAVAYLAGGCFWCTEASFERIRGVQAVVSGYSGGPEVDPTYKQVASGQTGHAEAIAVYYDPDVVDYETLLEVFFVAHDPTTLNRQGPDVGPQYRSAIFFQTPEEEATAREVIAEVNESGRYSNPIVTEVTAFDVFYAAEDYHQDYLADPSNPNQGYVQSVSWPKVRKVVKEFEGIVKPKYL